MFVVKPAVRALALLLAFAAGFGAVARVIGTFAPPLGGGGAGSEAEWWGDHPEFDTILIGSSRTNRQVIPRLFDETMAAAGIQTRAINLARDGMRPPEDGFVLDEALARRNAPLRLVVMELNPVEMRITDADLETEREIAWHDADRMRILWMRVWSGAGGDERRIGRRLSDWWGNLRYFGTHAQLWLWAQSRVGVGSGLVEQRLRLQTAPTRRHADLGPLGDGFRAAAGDDQLDARERKHFASALATMQGGRRITTGDGATQFHLREWARRVRALGARLVIVSPPTTKMDALQPDPGLDAWFFDFSDPVQYPELFAPEHRRDEGHLNMQGSMIYTRLMAEQIARRLRAD
jgi:hypothetical protein